MEDVIYIPYFDDAAKERRDKLIARFVANGWIQRGRVELTDSLKNIIPVTILTRLIK